MRAIQILPRQIRTPTWLQQHACGDILTTAYATAFLPADLTR